MRLLLLVKKVIFPEIAGISRRWKTHATGQHFFRRIASIFYDSLVLAGVLMLAGALAVAAGRGHLTQDPWRSLYQLYLLLTIYAYFVWFWVHGGQTPGMRAWRLRLTDPRGQPVSWKQATLRFCAALLSWLPAGLGFIWMLLDRDSLAWHDRLSATRLKWEPKTG